MTDSSDWKALAKQALEQNKNLTAEEQKDLESVEWSMHEIYYTLKILICQKCGEAGIDV